MENISDPDPQHACPRTVQLIEILNSQRLYFYQCGRVVGGGGRGCGGGGGGGIIGVGSVTAFNIVGCGAIFPGFKVIPTGSTRI